MGEREGERGERERENLLRKDYSGRLQRKEIKSLEFPNRRNDGGETEERGRTEGEKSGESERGGRTFGGIR